MDPRVKAVRDDRVIGSRTCSYASECFSDTELAEYLDTEGCTDPAAAVKEMRDYEALQLEQATNCRWGADTDPELSAKAQFEAECKEHPIKVAE